MYVTNIKMGATQIFNITVTVDKFSVVCNCILLAEAID